MAMHAQLHAAGGAILTPPTFDQARRKRVRTSCVNAKNERRRRRVCCREATMIILSQTLEYLPKYLPKALKAIVSESHNLKHGT
jgi:hypothetical protein